MSIQRIKRGLLVLALAAPVHAGSKSNSAIKAFNDGVGLINGSHYQEAIAHFDDAIAADSEFAEAYYLRGVCRYSLKSHENALMDLSDAIRIKPDFIDAYALRGLLHYEADRYDEALTDVNFVLARKPDDAQSLLLRGIIELKREEAEGAARDFRAFLKLRPDDPMAPQIREVLASLGGAPAPAASAKKHATTAHRSAPPADTASAPRSSAPGAQPTINTRALAEKFGRRVLQGDQAPVVGDINERQQIKSDGQ
jgi:tetratricopeptide (TPR) repeat protein